MSLKISPAAQTKIASLLNSATPMLRVAVWAGGCNGLEYRFDLTSHTDKFDVLLEQDGAKIVVDKKSFSVLDEATLDWESGLMQKRFVMRFPDSRRTCSCGTSFSL